MLLGFLHISPCVSLKVKAGPRHERMNYSTLPLIDSAGDYANSYTSTLLYHCDRAMTGMKCRHWDKQSQRNSQWRGGVATCRKGLKPGFTERPASEGVPAFWYCSCISTVAAKTRAKEIKGRKYQTWLFTKNLIWPLQTAGSLKGTVNTAN